MDDPLRLLIKEIKEKVNKKYEKTEYTERYVAFIDVMGMKNLLDKEYSYPRKVFNNIEAQLLIYSIGVPGGRSFLDQIKVSIISDSLVISINCYEDYALSKLIGFTTNLIKTSLDIIDNQPIFYRGE